MKLLNNISKLEKIINKYEAFLIDLWGVIHNDIEPYNGAVEAINKLLHEKDVLFLSNTPRPGALSFQKLKKFGINLQESQVYTSGDLVREQLQNWDDEIFSKLGRKFYHLGALRNQDILHNLDVMVIEDINKADFVLLTAYLEEEEDMHQYDHIFELAKIKELPFICVNPDKVAYVGTKKRFCAGTLATRYENIGGTVYYYGKPDSKIYRKALNKLNIDKSKILMIGDTLATDIKGALLSGIDSALVLTGNGKDSLEELKINNSISPNFIIKDLN